jgi:MFS family permease
MVASVTLGIIFRLFTEQGERARALAYYVAASAVGVAIGILIGGLLTQVAGWPWIFYVNVPFGVAMLVLGLRLLPNDEGLGISMGADIGGALLISTSMLVLIYGVVKSSDHGWGSSQTIGCLIGAAALMATFVALESHLRVPLIPLRIFRTHNLSAANLTQLLANGVFLSHFFLISLYLQHVLSYSPLYAGLAFLPHVVMVGLTSVVLLPRILRRVSAKRALFIGLALVAAGLVLLTMIPVNGGYWTYILPAILLTGTSVPLIQTATYNFAMAEVAAGDSGLASGLVNTSRQVGSALGLAVVASVATAHSKTLLAHHVPLSVALTRGYDVSYWITLGFVTAAAITATRLRAPTGE